MGRATVSMAWTLRPAEFRVNLTLTKLCFSSQAVSWKVIKPKTRKGGSLPKGTWTTPWWCETRALWLFAYCKNRPRCMRRRVVNATLQFTNYEICTSPSRENAKARGKIPHAASFPWPNWNYLHIYLFPINVWLSACVQLEIWGRACLLLKGPLHMGGPRKGSIWPSLIRCRAVKQFHHTHLLTSVQPLAIQGRLPCSSFSIAVVQNVFYCSWSCTSSGFTWLLSLDFVSLSQLEGDSLSSMAALACASVTLPCFPRTMDLNHPLTCSTLRHSDFNFLLPLSSSGPWDPNCNPDLSRPSPLGIGVWWHISSITLLWVSILHY